MLPTPLRKHQNILILNMPLRKTKQTLYRPAKKIKTQSIHLSSRKTTNSTFLTSSLVCESYRMKQSFNGRGQQRLKTMPTKQIAYRNLGAASFRMSSNSTIDRQRHKQKHYNSLSKIDEETSEKSYQHQQSIFLTRLASIQQLVDKIQTKREPKKSKKWHSNFNNITKINIRPRPTTFRKSYVYNMKFIPRKQKNQKEKHIKPNQEKFEIEGWNKDESEGNSLHGEGTFPTQKYHDFDF